MKFYESQKRNYGKKLNFFKDLKKPETDNLLGRKKKKMATLSEILEPRSLSSGFSLKRTTAMKILSRKLRTSSLV